MSDAFEQMMPKGDKPSATFFDVVVTGVDPVDGQLEVVRQVFSQ